MIQLHFIAMLRQDVAEQGNTPILLLRKTLKNITRVSKNKEKVLKSVPKTLFSHKMFADTEKKAYLCIVFFMVLDF